MTFGRYYHGDGGDQSGQVGAFFNGTGRYRVLWDDDKIKPEFGILAGVTKDSCRKFINCPTLTGGKKKITGRQLLAKAKAAIKESKVLLAYWNDYSKSGGFPSGKNENDALLFCVESVTTENTQNLEKEEDTEDEEEEDDSPAPEPARTVPQPPPPRRNTVVDSEDEAEVEGDEDEDDNEEVEYIAKKTSPPSAMVTFMLFGPYGVKAYGFEASAAFTVDTEAIEANAKTGIYNTKSIKEEKKAAIDIVRYVLNHLPVLITYANFSSNLHVYIYSALKPTGVD